MHVLERESHAHEVTSGGLSWAAVLFEWLECMITECVYACGSCFCRYLQQLIDFEIETAKAKGVYENGVLFLEKAVRFVNSEVVWQQGQDTTKQVCIAPSLRVFRPIPIGVGVILDYHGCV